MKIYLKYDNMHQEHMNGSLKCTNNYVITSKYCILGAILILDDHTRISFCIQLTNPSTPISISPAPLHSTFASSDPPIYVLRFSISLRMGIRSHNQHPTTPFVSYDCLHPTYHTFFLFVSFYSLPNKYHEVVHILEWEAAMELLHHPVMHYGIWDLAPDPTNVNLFIANGFSQIIPPSWHSGLP